MTVLGQNVNSYVDASYEGPIPNIPPPPVPAPNPRARGGLNTDPQLAVPPLAQLEVLPLTPLADAAAGGGAHEQGQGQGQAEAKAQAQGQAAAAAHELVVTGKPVLAAAPALREGFAAKVPAKAGAFRFAELLDQLCAAHPEVRFRFTSPHPKDFPDPLLAVLAARPNACKALHIPAQSGSTSVLAAMKRGYDREAYLRLIERVRELLPSATISSDFISGFCGESEEDHMETLSLMEEVCSMHPQHSTRRTL